MSESRPSQQSPSLPVTSVLSSALLAVGRMRASARITSRGRQMLHSSDRQPVIKHELSLIIPTTAEPTLRRTAMAAKMPLPPGAPYIMAINEDTTFRSCKAHHG